jgi:hypothetical protein
LAVGMVDPKGGQSSEPADIFCRQHYLLTSSRSKVAADE